MGHKKEAFRLWIRYSVPVFRILAVYGIKHVMYDSEEQLINIDFFISALHLHRFHQIVPVQWPWICRYHGKWAGANMYGLFSDNGCSFPYCCMYTYAKITFPFSPESDWSTWYTHNLSRKKIDPGDHLTCQRNPKHNRQRNISCNHSSKQGTNIVQDHAPCVVCSRKFYRYCVQQRSRYCIIHQSTAKQKNSVHRKIQYRSVLTHQHRQCQKTTASQKDHVSRRNPFR